VVSSYELEQEMSLNDLYLLAFDKLSPQSCYNTLLEINLDLNPSEKEKVGTLIYLPAKESCPYKLPETSFSAAINSLPEESQSERQKYFANLEGSFGYYYSTIKGTNDANDTELNLNSENNYSLKLASTFFFDKWRLKPAFTFHNIEFENNLSTNVYNTKLNVSYLGLEAKYQFSDEWSFIFAQTFGESVLHNDRDGDINLFKIYKWTGLVGIEWSKEYGNKLKSTIQILAGQSLIVSHQDDEPEGGLNYQVGLRLETIEEDKSNFYIEIKNQVQNESIGKYKQELIYTGMSLGLIKNF
jgi:hypothetical protein